MEGQSFDTLQLAWENNGSLGENVSGYIIKFTHKVNNFLDKIQTFNFFGRSTMDTKYIIVLPNDTPYKTGLLSVDDISKKLIP